jgi:multidrug efflux pump subunit AcrB
MTTSQFFVYKRPIAWTALLVTLAWGGLAYLAMPQRHDPILPVRMGVVATPYPGARAEKVEQEVTRKIERKLGENAAVETVSSLSRPGLSVVYVELSEYEKNAEQVWQDLQGKLENVTDLPRVGDRPVQPVLDKDYGDTVAVMLTISSPPVSDLEIELRAQDIRAVLEPARAARPAEFQARRVSGVLVYPNTVARASVLRIGRTLLQRLTEAGVIQDGRILDQHGRAAADPGALGA